MCNYYLINELALGNRSLGFEFATEKEVVEMTAKIVKDNIKAGKKIHGLQIAGKEEELVLDEKFYMRNYTVKTHINNIRPKYEYEGQCVANIMYIVIGSHEENGKTVYDVISSRVERTTFGEEKLKAMYDLGFISGGCKVENDKIILPNLDTKEEPKPILVEAKPEQPKVMETVEVKEETVKPEIKQEEKKEETVKTEVKKEDKKVETVKQEIKPTDKKSETSKEKTEQKKAEKAVK